MSTPCRILIAGLYLLLAPFVATVRGQATVAGTSVLIPLAEADTVEGIQALERRLAEAFHRVRVAAGPSEVLAAELLLREQIRVMQSLIDGVLKRNFLFASDTRLSWKSWLARLGDSEPKPERRDRMALATAPGLVFRNVEDALVRLARGLPDRAGEIYREEFSLTATSSYVQALGLHDPDALFSAGRRYPLAAMSVAAMIAAGDVFFERGELERAQFVWDHLDPDYVHREYQRRTDVPADSDEVIRQSEAAALPLITLENLAFRQLTVAVELKDEDRYRAWIERVSDRPQGARWISQLPNRLRPGREGLAWIAAAREARWPTLDVDNLSFSLSAKNGGWQSLPLSRTAHGLYSYESTDYLSVPTAGDGWIAVNRPDELMVLRLNNGLKVQSYNNWGTARSRRTLGRPRGQSFRERDPLARLQPEIINSSDEKTPLIIASYVKSASDMDRYAGYQITVSVPQRSLIAIPKGRKLPAWDTGSNSTLRRDALVHAMSFNTRPVADAGRVFALGWHKAGYINAHLVCLDAATGHTIWNTLLVGNQVDLTMFGEIAYEPILGSVHVEGNVVYVSTNLGVIAAVNAWDGEIRWLTPYESQPPQPNRYGRVSRSRHTHWARNPVILFEGRAFVTPLDSDRLFVVDVDSGRILNNRVTAIEVGHYMLGVSGDHLVFCDSKSVKLRKARDVVARGEEYTIAAGGRLRARPALIHDGLVFSTQRGVYAQKFRPQRSFVTLFEFPGDEIHTEVRDGHVLVVGDRVIVGSSQRVRCFNGTPRERSGR